MGLDFSRVRNQAIRERVFKRDRFTCVACGWMPTAVPYPYFGWNTVERLEIDHKHPLARGGSDGIRNLQTLCRRCNRQKNTLTPRQWKQRLAESRTTEAKEPTSDGLFED